MATISEMKAKLAELEKEPTLAEFGRTRRPTSVLQVLIEAVTGARK